MTRIACGLAEPDQTLVLRVERDVALRRQALLDDGLRDLVDRERGVATGRVADLDPRLERPEVRRDRVVDARRDLDRELVRVHCAWLTVPTAIAVSYTGM